MVDGKLKVNRGMIAADRIEPLYEKITGANSHLPTIVTNQNRADLREVYTHRIYSTAAITIAIWILLIWDHFHGGVPSHHLLQREDLPEFSNWWGGILLPLLTWFLLYRIQKRISLDVDISKSSALYAFMGALCFGIVLSVFFTFNYTDIPFYMLIGLLILSLFFPIYRAECFLGFAIGMTFTFGGVLPILIGSILALIGLILYLVFRPALLFVKSGVTGVLFPKRNNQKGKRQDYKNEQKVVR